MAVPAYHLPAGRVTGWASGGFALPERYVVALRRAGLAPVLVPGPVGPAPAEEVLAPFAGLLLAGGGDVDPARYGAERHPKVYGVDPDRDAAEFALVPAARRAGLPVLAICRGFQVVNVACGGTLAQHLPDDIGRAAHGDPTGGLGVTHGVRVAEGSRLHEAVAGAERIARCASHHHQGVDRVGAGLAPVGWSDDGLVEALEPEDADGAWMVAVQWHPEETAADDPAQRALFDAFAARAREHAGAVRA